MYKVMNKSFGAHYYLIPVLRFLPNAEGNFFWKIHYFVNSSRILRRKSQKLWFVSQWNPQVSLDLQTPAERSLWSSDRMNSLTLHLNDLSYCTHPIRVFTRVAGPGPSCRWSCPQLQLTRLTAGCHLRIAMVRQDLLRAESTRWAGPGLRRHPGLQHLTLDIRHLAADFGHLSFEADQDAGVWSRSPHRLRPPLSFFSRVNMGWRWVNTEETRLMKCKLCLLLCLVKLTLSDICRHIWQDVRRWMNNHVVAAVYFRCCSPTFLELKYLAKNLCLLNQSETQLWPVTWWRNQRRQHYIATK